MDIQRMSGSQLLIPEIGFQCSSNNFLTRSTSNVKWFVWPELCVEQSDIAWIDEGKLLLIYQISSMVSVLFHCPIHQISFNRHDKAWLVHISKVQKNSMQKVNTG